MPSHIYDLQTDLQVIIKEQRQHVSILEKVSYNTEELSGSQPTYTMHLMKQFDQMKENSIELIGQLERVHSSIDKIEQRHIREQLIMQNENRHLKEELHEQTEKLKSDKEFYCKQVEDSDSKLQALNKRHSQEVESLRSQLRKSEVEKTGYEKQVRHLNAQLIDMQAQLAQFQKDDGKEESTSSTGDESLDESSPVGDRSLVDCDDSIMDTSLATNQMHLQLMDLLEKQQEEDVRRLQAAKQQSSQQLVLMQSKMDFIRQKTSQLSIKTGTMQREQKSLLKFVKELPEFVQSTVNSTIDMVRKALQDVSQMNELLTRKYSVEMKLRKRYHNELIHLKGNIRVMCRVRPVIPEDGIVTPSDIVVHCDDSNDSLISLDHRAKTHHIHLDRVFSMDATQQQVYEEVSDLVLSCVDGYNVCIFAYGQTGSGKTHTMQGSSSDDQGINQRALSSLLDEVERRDEWNYTITVSFMEIYNEQIRDLLCQDATEKLEVKMNPEGGLYVPGLTYMQAHSLQQIMEVFEYGTQNRATMSTDLNEHSSRSHAILMITVCGHNVLTGTKTSGKLHLVDLAGSERVSKSGASGTRLREAQNINKSLSCIADVIHALGAKHTHVPFRNSKLTYLLQDSLGGDSKTMMIVHVAPVMSNAAESMASLNFAQRVKRVELSKASIHATNVLQEVGQSSGSPGARVMKRVRCK